jgi:predicted esterase
MLRAIILSVLLATTLQADPAAATNAPPAHPPVDLKKLVNKLVYQIDPSVFSTKDFPAGAFQQDAMVRSALGPVQVATTYYNEKFEEVKTADTPGRYGAVVRITLGDGTQLNRFITLYRLPDNATTQTINLGRMKLPLETGTDPGVAERQPAELAIALKSALSGDSGSAGFGVLLAITKAMPGATPQQLFSTLMTYMATDDQWWFDLRKRIGLSETYQYLTQLPDGYDTDTTKHYPLVLFLHGSGDRGTDMTAVARDGSPKKIAGGLNHTAIVIAPQCPDEWWSAPVLGQLLDDLSAKYRVDSDRIIVTGASMGGYGTWALGVAYPDRFAAIAPVCGGGNPAGAASLVKLPVWAFHGALDTTVPEFLSQDMVDAINKAGGDAHLTIYPTTKHNAWDQAYATDALYTWMLAQQRGKPEVKTPGLQTP